jgi:chorismate dehydratase
MTKPDGDAPKLRMAPRETTDELLHRAVREQRAQNLKRETGLQESLAPFRVGSVPYLNAVPLTRGLEDQMTFAPPAQLAEMLRRDELDAGLVSVTEVLFTDRYDILDGIAVASLGEVKSVFLAHRGPVQEAAVIYSDPASLTSAQLLRVLLAERGLKPSIQPLSEAHAASPPDYFLRIGDPAIEFLRTPHEHEIWDLGAAWLELTGRPFVYAVWALRRGQPNERLRKQLREAKDFGLETLDHIIRSRPEFDAEFRRDYLSWHIHYHLGEDEKRGLNRFIELLRKHELGDVRDPVYVF